MLVRRASPEDLAAIAAIQAASPEAAQWDPQNYLEHFCVVVVIDAHIAGFLVSREVGPGEREILNLAVDPRQRRQGAAKRLLQEELTAGRAIRFLEVRASNQPAIQLYSGMGFRVAGVRENYYSDPPEAAIVMRLVS
jgi:ribosomal-protein-alanine N-acetyltransferase